MNPMKILLVDDSKSARYALRLQLQRHGAQVETADSAEAALERIKEAPPDAVFMDHTMPGMNGFEALEILKGSPTTAPIPVVMCTSNEDPDFITQAHRKGAMDVLAKSAAPDKLPALIEQLRTAVEGAPATPPPPAEAVPGLTEAVTAVARREADRLIAERLDAALDRRVEALLAGHAERLKGELLAQVQAGLDERFADETKRLQAHLVAVQAEQAQQSAQRIAKEVLPEAVDRQLSTQHQDLARLVQELIDHSLDGLAEDPGFLRRVLDSTEASAANAAEQSVRRYMDELGDDSASEQAGRMADGLGEVVRAQTRTMYVLAAAAALVGMAAAGAVYLLLA